MLKLVIVGTIVAMSYANERINPHIVAEIKRQTDSWVPYEHHENPLRNYSFYDLLKTMGTGLLVTELLGHGINMVTGDYSRGAAGFWVENGVIVHPVEEITIAGNLREMFKQIVAIGNDVLIQGSKQMGSVLIENMTVAGD